MIGLESTVNTVYLLLSISMTSTFINSPPRIKLPF